MAPLLVFGKLRLRFFCVRIVRLFLPITADAHLAVGIFGQSFKFGEQRNRFVRNLTQLRCSPFTLLNVSPRHVGNTLPRYLR